MKTRPEMRSLRCGFAASLMLIAALAIATPALAAPADGHIYWTTRSGDIARANLDGTGVNRQFIAGAAVFPSAITASGHHLYWVDTNRDTIGRANLDGTGVDRTFLSFPSAPSVFRPHDIAIRAGHIYWANWSAFIGRARIDGTHAQLKFIQIKGFAPGYLAAGVHHLYWTGIAFEEPNVIGRAKLDGSGVKNIFISSETSPFHVAVAGSHLYWTTPTNAIVRANLDGSGVRPRFITSAKGQPGGLAVGGGRIYWTALAHSSTNPDDDTLLGRIGDANLDGKGVRWITAGADEASPTDIAVVPGAPRRGHR
ncbi:MAG TPA: hypothetical protein VHR18_05345 [Solirubrobacterales bacterium]|jgi:hypothetical protein|nr:hypothetical protein [Solirubrobacterales bacterium]